MEKEYWRRERPSSVAEGLRGLVDWLNSFNLQRPHGGIGFKAPADLAPWHTDLRHAYWDQVDVPATIGPTPGVVEAVRRVGNDGAVDTWGQRLQLSRVLAGQYVRMRFDVSGSPGRGTAHYELSKGRDVVVATFGHKLDVPGAAAGGWQCCSDVRLFEFEGSVPHNELADEFQVAAQQSRILKRRTPLATALDRLAGDGG